MTSSLWYCSICASLIARTRSPATEAVLRSSVDHGTLSAAKVVTLFTELRFDPRFEPVEGVRIAADERPLHGIRGHGKGKRLDMGQVNKR